MALDTKQHRTPTTETSVEYATATATPAADTSIAAPLPVTPTPDGQSIRLRGTLRRQLTIPRQANPIKAPVRLPTARRKGNYLYLKQVVLTVAPLLVGDLAVLVGTVAVCTIAGLDWAFGSTPAATAFLWFPPVACSFLLINFVLGLYPGTRLGVVEEIEKLTLSYSLVALITAARVVPLVHRTGVERLYFLLIAYALCVIAAPIVRSRLRRLLGKTQWWGFPTLVCGHDTAAFSVCEWLDNNRRLGLRPVGVVADPDTLELGSESSRFIGPWPRARDLAEMHDTFWAVLVESPDASADPSSLVDMYLPNIPHVFVVSERTGMPDHWDRHQMDEGLSGFTVEQHLLLPIPKLLKRGMDLTIALAVGLLLIPLFAVLAVAIKLTSKGPIFYGHERVGQGNTRFKAWKFRTMCVDADKIIFDYLAKHPQYREEWERDHKLKNDPRVNGLGKFMRKWSIDELPQVWNVLRGEMSVVGPRPIVEAEIPKYAEHFETFSTVPPGITGLWQVCGRNDTTYEERVQLDVFYVHHWSPWFDLYLLARTVKTVIFTKGAY